MPRLIEPDDAPAIGLDELLEALTTSKVDTRDEEAFASLGPLLARLGRNQRFLADLAIAELKDRHQRQGTNTYGPQVFMLHPPDGRFVVRANFWPARADAIVRASGTAPFFYDFAHDHNFSFLTYGYFGPGYWSDYYEYDVASVAGEPGEAVALHPVGRQRLEPGRLMLYRARRDIHVQLPPDQLSVSLNILAQDPAQLWRDQYEFDVVGGRIIGCLTTTPSEALVALAVHLGGGNGIDLASDFAKDHPSPRMRATAAAALASAAQTGGDAAEHPRQNGADARPRAFALG